MSKAKRFYGLMTIAERSETKPEPKYRVGQTIIINGERVTIRNVKTNVKNIIVQH